MICSKLQAVPFPGGLRASRPALLPISDSHFVANSKSGSFSGSNTTERLVSYARGDIGPPFAATYRLPIPKHAPFAIGYEFLGKPHDYLPDVVGTLLNGKVFIAEAGMEDDKRQDRNLTKAEAARRLARLQRGAYWIATEKTLTRQRHYNLVFLHARRQVFPAFADIAVAVQEVWPWGEVASVEEVESRLAGRLPANLVEAAIWKLVGDSAAAGHLLVDLEKLTLDRKLPLALLPPDAAPLVPDPLPDTLLANVLGVEEATALPEPRAKVAGPTGACGGPRVRQNGSDSRSGPLPRLAQGGGLHAPGQTKP